MKRLAHTSVPAQAAATVFTWSTEGESQDNQGHSDPVSTSLPLKQTGKQNSDGSELKALVFLQCTRLRAQRPHRGS